MKRFFHAALAALGLSSGCSDSHVLTPAQFTSEYVNALRETLADSKVTVFQDLQLKVTFPDGRESTAFLDNAYDTYKLDPSAKTDVIARFVTAGRETYGGALDQKVDRTRIVPVIKDRPWLKEAQQAVLQRGAKAMPEQVFEDFNSDLVILYAEDSPKSIRYLTRKDLDRVGIRRDELRALACENLRRLLPKFEQRGSPGLYMLTAGGDYEASLLLLDSIWSSGTMEVQGDLVIAIPSRDLLFVTGSREQAGLEKVKQMVAKAYNENAYRLTPKLFVYRDGKFTEFKSVQ